MEKAKFNTGPAYKFDADNITTDTVQFWYKGCMMTAMMTKETAQRKVREGSAYVITGQAIGALINHKMEG